VRASMISPTAISVTVDGVGLGAGLFVGAGACDVLLWEGVGVALAGSVALWVAASSVGACVAWLPEVQAVSSQAARIRVAER
jgi:hypothetical protein